MTKKKFVNGMDSGRKCPECGGRLLIRENRHTGHQFLGCEFYPECNGTMEIPEEMRMKLSGAPELPLAEA